MLPLLLRLDPNRIELYVYHTGTMHDEYTRQAERWYASGEDTLKSAASSPTIVST